MSLGVLCATLCALCGKKIQHKEHQDMIELLPRIVDLY